MWIFIPRLTLKAGGWNTKITSCWGYFSYFVTRSLKKYLSLLFAEGHGEIVKFLSVVWTCSPSPLFILVPEERLCDGEDVWGSAWLIALFGWGFPYHNWEETPFGVQAEKTTQRVLSWNRTNYFDHADALLWFLAWLRCSRSRGNHSNRDCRFVLSLLLLCTRRYYYCMLMFPLRRNHGGMRASNAAPSPAVHGQTAPCIFHVAPTCESSSSLKGWMSFITRITFTTSDIVFSNCVDLFTFKGQPPSLAKFNLTENSEEGTASTHASPSASKRSKLIYPINEEWGLMLMRDDNSTGQLFFIALLLLLWTNHMRQSDKYFHDSRASSFPFSVRPPLKDDRTWYGSLRK